MVGWLLLSLACRPRGGGGDLPDTGPFPDETGRSDVTLSPGEVAFGDVIVGCVSPARELVLANGSGEAAAVQLSLESDAADQFRLELDPSRVDLPDGEQVRVPVRFAPTRLGRIQGVAVTAHVLAPQDAWLRAFVGGTGVEGDTRTFTATPAPRAEVDLVVVVDPGSALAAERAALRATSQALFDALAARGVDAQVGVVTADVEPGGRRGALVAPVITALTADPAAALADALAVAGDPLAPARPLAASNAALTFPLVATDNAGLRRDGVPTVVLMITDRDDASDFPVDAWRRWADDEVAAAIALSGPPGAGCVVGEHAIAAAPRLHQATVGAGDVWLDLCQLDAATAWQEVAAVAAGDVVQVVVSPDGVTPVPGTASVARDGEPVAADPVDGWTLDSGTRITLHGAARPAPGQEIEVRVVDARCAEVP